MTDNPDIFVNYVIQKKDKLNPHAVGTKLTSSQYFDVINSLYQKIVTLVTICDEYVTKQPKLMSYYIALIYSSILLL